MPAVFTNNASTTLASGITNVQTSITLATGTGALFPALTAGQFFYATIVNASNQIEIVKCTSRSGDTLTVVRGQEGTTARAYLTGDKVELRVTAAGLANKVAYDDNTFAVTEAQVTGLVADLAAITGQLFVTGTSLVFYQAGAPTGWTQDTSKNDFALRLVSGVGGGSHTGAQAFSSAVGTGSVGGHSLSQAELPNCSFPVSDPGHQHTEGYWAVGGTGGIGRYAQSGTGTQTITNPATTGISVSSGGAGNAHGHSWTGSALDISYANCIICSKN